MRASLVRQSIVCSTHVGRQAEEIDMLLLTGG